MKIVQRKFWCWALVVLAPTAFAQRVKIGYDKSVDFSKYKSYTWATSTTPTMRPLLKEIVIGFIEEQLKSKGLSRSEDNGDLILIGTGGVDFGVNQAAGTPILPVYGGPPPTFDSSMWAGATGPSTLTAPYVPKGTLILDFVDRSTKKAIWAGTVSQKLDLERKQKSLDLVDKAIAKLLKSFPPKTASAK